MHIIPSLSFVGVGRDVQGSGGVRSCCGRHSIKIMWKLDDWIQVGRSRLAKGSSDRTLSFFFCCFPICGSTLITPHGPTDMIDRRDKAGRQKQQQRTTSKPEAVERGSTPLEPFGEPIFVVRSDCRPSTRQLLHAPAGALAVHCRSVVYDSRCSWWQF